MSSDMINESIQKTTRSLYVLWAFLGAAAFLYIPISYYDIYIKKVAHLSVNSYLLNSLPIIAIFLGLVSLGLRYRLLSDPRIKIQLSKKPNLLSLAKDPRSGEINEKKLKEITNLNSYQQKLLAFPKYVFSVSLTSWLLNNLIAFIGFIFSLLTRSFQSILFFEIAVLVLNFNMRPRLLYYLERAEVMNAELQEESKGQT